MEFIRAGGLSVVFGKKLQSFAASALGIELKPVFARSKEISHEGQGLTAVEKIFNRNAVGVSGDTVLHAGSDVRVKVNIVGSQDTTGLMTSQELESMAATLIAPTVDGAYQSGVIRPPSGIGAEHPQTDEHASVWLDYGKRSWVSSRDDGCDSQATVDEWAIIIGGDSHTRMSKGVAFGADSGTVALALATGEATMPIPESVKVTFKGELKITWTFGMWCTPGAQMLKVR